MKFSNRLLCLVATTALALASAAVPVEPAEFSKATDTSSKASATPISRYRISPIDGSIIALPTKEQLDFMDKEIGILIHFEIATYLEIDGCNNVPWLVPNATIFDPELLNTDNWMDSITGLGAKYATLVAKHNCGFTLWPSNVKFPTRDNETIWYNYTIAQSSVSGLDVVRSFVQSAQKYNIGHGFYYSTNVNNFLNVQNSEVNATSWSPGQVRITNTTYDQIVDDQLTELWSNYGTLTEIWFDGGYSATQKSRIQQLLSKHQPHAVIFNSCDQDSGSCLSEHAVRWIGNEKGEAPIENWSSGYKYGGGDPNSPVFCPGECDTTLQKGTRWFYGVDTPLRSIEELIEVYHRSVGRNCVLELDLSPDRSGLIRADHAARYKQLGNFIQSCYGKPVKSASSSSNDGTSFSLKFDHPTTIDRISLMENQEAGQVIRTYQVSAKVVDATGINGTLTLPWITLSNGTSVGHKKIDIFEKPVTVTEVLVRAMKSVDTPKWRSVNVYLCERLIPNRTVTYDFNQT